MKDNKIFDVKNITVENLESATVTKTKKRGRPAAANSIDASAAIFLADPTEKNFQNLWERAAIGLQAHAAKICNGDVSLAQDVVIDVMTKVWEKRDQFDPTKAKFSTWMYKICFNDALQRMNTIRAENSDPNDFSDIYESSLKKNQNCEAFSDDAVQLDSMDADFQLITKESVVTKMINATIEEIKNISNPNIVTVMLERYGNIDDIDKPVKLLDIAKKYNFKLSDVKNWIFAGKRKVREGFAVHHPELLEYWNEVK